MIVPPENSQTTDGPMSEVEALAREVETRRDILSASAFPVQPWLDVPELGFAAVVVAAGPGDAAQAAADEIARAAWERRARFLVPLVGAGRGGRAERLSAEGPVALVDSADGTSSGAPGDSTAILHALLRAQPGESSDKVALLTIVDPEAARRGRRGGRRRSARPPSRRQARPGAARAGRRLRRRRASRRRSLHVLGGGRRRTRRRHGRDRRSPNRRWRPGHPGGRDGEGGRLLRPRALPKRRPRAPGGAGGRRQVADEPSLDVPGHRPKHYLRRRAGCRDAATDLARLPPTRRDRSIRSTTGHW